MIISIDICVKIKHVAKRRKQLQSKSTKTLKYRVKKILKKLLTSFRHDDILSKSLKGDTIKQENTTKVVERKWSLKIEQNIINTFK